MATLMEKDVLIEITASGLALISHHIANEEQLKENHDWLRLLEIRNFLYQTFAPELDYENILNECKSIKQKYL